MNRQRSAIFMKTVLSAMGVERDVNTVTSRCSEAKGGRANPSSHRKDILLKTRQHHSLLILRLFREVNPRSATQDHISYIPSLNSQNSSQGR